MNRAALTMIFASISGWLIWDWYGFPASDLLLRHIRDVKPPVYWWLYWTWAVVVFGIPAGIFFGIFTLTGVDKKKDTDGYRSSPEARTQRSSGW